MKYLVSFVFFSCCAPIFSSHDVIEHEIHLKIKENLTNISSMEPTNKEYWYLAGKNEGLLTALSIIHKEEKLNESREGYGRKIH